MEAVDAEMARINTTSMTRISKTALTALATLMLGLTLSAPAAQAIYIDLSSIGTGWSNLTVEGHALTIQARQIRFLGLEHVSIRFDDGPVALESIAFDFEGQNASVFANVMGNVARVRGTADNTARLHVDGRQGTTLGFTSLGSRSRLRGLDLDFSPVGSPVGGATASRPSSPIPEPHAALLFGTGIAFVALRARRQHPALV